MDGKGAPCRLTPEERAYAEELIQTYGVLIRHTARRYLGQDYAKDMEDVVQDTYEAICRQVDQFAFYENKGALIVTITMRTAKRYRKKNNRFVPLEIELTAPERGPAGLDELLPRATSEGDRDLLNRFYVYRETTGQIATELGEQESTIRQRLKRARDRLRKRLIQINKKMKK